MAKHRRTLILSALCALGLSAGWFYLSGHATPSEQAPLASITQRSFSSFKEEFNDSADRVRLVVLLSPT